VLGRAGDEVEARAGAEREHEVVVGEVALAGEGLAAQGSLTRIYVGDAAHDEPRARLEHGADRRHRVLGEERRADRFGQHRIESGVALLRDQRELGAARQVPLQRAHQGRAGEAAAGDHDVRLHGALGRAMGSFLTL
jgi:hypothetical protein